MRAGDGKAEEVNEASRGEGSEGGRKTRRCEAVKKVEGRLTDRKEGRVVNSR